MIHYLIHGLQSDCLAGSRTGCCDRLIWGPRVPLVQYVITAFFPVVTVLGWVSRNTTSTYALIMNCLQKVLLFLIWSKLWHVIDLEIQKLESKEEGCGPWHSLRFSGLHRARRGIRNRKTWALALARSSLAVWSGDIVDLGISFAMWGKLQFWLILNREGDDKVRSVESYTKYYYFSFECELSSLF